jgi:hypothetical protein
VQPSLRKVLIDSHVAAAVIAVMFFFSVGEVVFALKEPASQVISYLITAVAIRDIPSIPITRYYVTSSMLPITLAYLLLATANLAAAWLLSRRVYGTGPLRTLGNYRSKLMRKKHA